jgi:hypothetical protein
MFADLLRCDRAQSGPYDGQAARRLGVRGADEKPKSIERPGGDVNRHLCRPLVAATGMALLLASASCGGGDGTVDVTL